MSRLRRTCQSVLLLIGTASQLTAQVASGTIVGSVATTAARKTRMTDREVVLLFETEESAEDPSLSAPVIFGRSRGPGLF